MASCSKWMRLLKSNGPTIHTGRAGPDHLLQLTYDWLTDWVTEWVSYCLLALLLSPIRPFHTSLLVLPASSDVFSTLCFCSKTPLCVILDVRFGFCQVESTFTCIACRVAEFFFVYLRFILDVRFGDCKKKKKTPIPQKTGDGQATAQKCWWEETKEESSPTCYVGSGRLTDRSTFNSTTITGTGKPAGWEKRNRSRGSREKITK